MDKYHFNVVIFDGASQVPVPLALMAVRKGSRFIFIGDQKQLPPALADIGIVLTYRSQGRAIHRELGKRFGAKATRGIIADTVERMQGQERELVIVSMATSDTNLLSAIATFFFQPERLNVSITRCMTKLIVIGPRISSNLNIEETDVSQWLTWYRELVSHCTLVAV